MKSIIRISGLLFLVLSTFLAQSCKKDKHTIPVITTTDVTEISYTSATSGGDLTDEGGTTVITRGVCWDTTSGPTIANSMTSDSCGSGSFVSHLTQLNPNTLYYIRAYATNIVGTGYGNQVSFITNQIAVPVLTTTAITSITQTSSVSGGIITTENGGSITARGVCWNTAPDPTISDSKTSDGSDIGIYSSTLIGLTQNTTYYVRAYAINSVGTGYGNSISFNTQNYPIIFNPNLTYGTVTDIDGNVYKTIIIGRQVWMAENLKTTKYNDGTTLSWIKDAYAWSNLKAPVYCWYNNDEANYKNTYGALYNWYTIHSRNLCPSGWHVPTDVEWRTLQNYLGGAGVAGDRSKEIGTTHWISPNAGATNERGFTALPCGSRHENGTFSGFWSQGGWWSSTETFIDGPIGVRNYFGWGLMVYWNISGILNGKFSKYLGLSVRCLRDEEEEVPALIPTLITIKASSVTLNTERSGGNIQSDGGALISAYGVCWSTSVNPTIADNKTTVESGAEGIYAPGIYTSILNGLAEYTTYFVRAYASNSIGTGYGNEISFTTQNNPAIFNQDLTYRTVTDIESNVYKTITIGTQTWMAENLKTTKYRNGDQIITTSPAERTITDESDPKYQWAYGGDENYAAIYGRLYTWFAITDPRNVCPTGWHVSTDAEWATMTTYLGGESTVSDKIKETGTAHWYTPNTGATNETGFTALPGGQRYNWGTFSDVENESYWWSSTERSLTSAWSWFTYSYDKNIMIRYSGYKKMAYSVRCVKD